MDCVENVNSQSVEEKMSDSNTEFVEISIEEPQQNLAISNEDQQNHTIVFSDDPIELHTIIPPSDYIIDISSGIPVSGGPGIASDFQTPSKWYNYTHYPTFTIIVSIVDIALLIWVLVIGGFVPLNVNPSAGPSAQTLLDAGGKWTPYILDRNEWWRLISPTFLHAGIFHLLSNLIVQVSFGWMLEQKYGTFRFATIYLLSGVGSIVMSAIFTAEYITVGASGAIFGIIMMWCVDVFQNIKILAHPFWSVVGVIAAIGLSIGMGFLPFVDNFAHIGGLIFGLELSMILIVKFEWDQPWKRRLRWILFYSFIVIFIGNFVGFFVMLYSRCCFISI
jgi:membrane associated rhomboid family serine protease